MKFLVVQPVSPLLAERLRDGGHAAFHLRERGLSRSRDDEIFAVAVAENRIIVTTDLDFSRILALSGRDGPGFILFRAGDISDQQMLSLLEAVLQRVPADRLSRSVVVLEGQRMRISPLPLRPDLNE